MQSSDSSFNSSSEKPLVSNIMPSITIQPDTLNADESIVHPLPSPPLSVPNPEQQQPIRLKKEKESDDSSTLLPFIHQKSRLSALSYLALLKSVFCPQLKLKSLTFLLINTLIWIHLIPQFIYKPYSYTEFLELSPDFHFQFLMNTDLHSQTHQFLGFCSMFPFTAAAMFIHKSYLHLLNNSLLSLLLLSEFEGTEKFGKKSIFLCLIGGWVTNCLVLKIGSGAYLGFSGALCSAIGLLAGFYILSWKDLFRAVEQNPFRTTIVISATLAAIIAMSSGVMGGATDVHGLGVLFGFFYSNFLVCPQSLRIAHLVVRTLTILISIVIVVIAAIDISL